MENQWVLKPLPELETIQLLMTNVNLPKSLAVILAQRDIGSFDSAKTYFRPQLEHLHNPFLMKDMENAVNRVILAIKNNEKILVYGDYDVDGTTSVAMMYDFLGQVYSNISYYIPNRYSEGYGISFVGIDFAKENGFSLVIALDCGIKANEKINYANEKGVDFIICDHHLPGEQTPNACAILDPKQKDCNYPFKELSGCGVGFKLMQALAPLLNIDEQKLFSYLDLVAVSIAADIVPIIDENRVLAHYGIIKLQESPRPGLRELLGKQVENIDISDIVFSVAPKINATGRLEHASQSVELLISTDESNISEIAVRINNLNAIRKEKDENVTTEAIEIIQKNKEEERFSTVVFSPNWHKGVLGIVASRLIETYYRPTLVLTEGNDGEISGSARSVKDFDIYEIIDSCSDLLTRYGGHRFAAGLSMSKENFEPFKYRFEELVKEKIKPNQRIPSIEIDVEIGFDEITNKFLKILKQMKPFGPQNMTPLFLSRNLMGGNIKEMGKDGGHLRLEVMDANKIKFNATAFGMGKYSEDFKYSHFDMVYSIRENHWRGISSLQLYVHDVRFKD